MKKEVFVLLFLASLTFLFLTKPATAQFFDGYGDIGGYGGRISLADFFDSLDPSTVTYGLLFFIFFTVIFLVLSRSSIFRGRRTHWGGEEPNTTAAGVVSFAISALIVYFMYRSGYNLESYFYEMGFSVDVFSFLMLALFVLMTFFLIKKFKSAGFFMILGLLLMFISIATNIIYEKETTFVIGVILFIVGIFLGKNTKKWWKKNMRTY
ncbi:MAG: hypothetical protein AABW93_01875 [Nanoarchaeota archaeon]